MSDQPVLFSRAAASCRLTLNREDKCHAINEEMIESLDHYLNEIENDTTLRLVELTATGDKFFCAGGDIELALCCDIRIARPGAKFSNPEVMLGMVPGWMGIERVLNQVGPVVGRQMLMLGKRLTAQEAQAANLIDEVVEKEQVESWMVNQLAQLEKCGPVALAHIKQLILALENKHADYPHQLLAGLMSATQDCQQATRAFAEKSSVSFHNQ
ncbi:TPA: enoyl-CoA hydratase/isomerase family protein [Escherichia coli]|uniref:enoyl-CoA hydratase/isomerase family protein n=1 Tax=Escherichia coli TaxID=562 RepID=UPI0020242998|nr:enoyl-CoA hydratase/isomerase family protein [Escherichia coli]EFN9185498.1 enoyl-CoA hydratase/isomerase family protein [Escherichia coli]EIT7523149.1 enoyl-CoA hydratase/isomerase family protein [Escherichia coli]MDS1737910.1 enoyl-CoA hydratase/isomerase family protein [Escherichia coli]HBB5031212.1 enoyl-CoA hydratase/isomerase family protein [Escherichia coli]HDW3678418.1 enoyl-CoA hydratase/isomerase family protein [Escherichia coli]